MPVLVLGSSCGTVLRHLVECTGAKPLRLELERQGSLAARGDGTAGPSGGRAGRVAFLATVPAVGVGSPCHVDAAWGRFGSFSWWHPSARTGRVQPAARERCDRNSKHPDCLQGHHHSTLRCGLCGRGHLPYPSAAPDIAKNTQSPVGSHRHHAPDFHVFSGPIHAGGFPYSNGALHVNSPHASARLSPYASAVLPYISTAPPYSHQAPKNPTPISARPAFPAPQTRRRSGLHKLPASAAGAVPHVRTGRQPAETSGRLTRIPCNKEGRLWQCAAPPAQPRLHRPGFTAIHARRIRPGPQKWGITNPPRPADGLRGSAHQSGLLKFHRPTTRGHGRRFATLRRRRRQGGSAACYGLA